MEKLKLFSAYLPFGLKGKLISDKTDDFAEQEWVNNISIFKKEAVWDLCGYADEKGELMIPLGEGYFKGWLWRNKTTYVNFHSGIKPILFSLEDLTKEITINGETFVPIVELAKIAGLKPFKGEYRREFLNDERAAFVECKHFESHGIKQRFAYFNDFGFRGTLDGYKAYKQFELREKLLEWKFNVFNLSETEYIKSTEESNPYS